MRRVGFGRHSYGSMRKRAPGPHVTVTEAQTLDEALEILRDKQHKRQRKSPSFKAQIASNNLRQRLKDITLPLGMKSDALVTRYRQPKSSIVRKREWSKQEVLEMTKTQTLVTVARITGVPGEQIRAWLYETGMWVHPSHHVLGILAERLAGQRARLKDLEENHPGREKGISNLRDKIQNSLEHIAKVKGKLSPAFRRGLP